MGTVALRSVFCGVAGAVMSVPVYVLAMIWWAARNMPSVPQSALPPGSVPGHEIIGEGEVGWDSLTMWHNSRGLTIAWMLTGFAIGFLLGWRSFSKRRSLQTV